MQQLTPLQRRRRWLLGVTLVAVLIVGGLLVRNLTELRKVREMRKDFTESFAPIVFQLEREFLRFSHVVDSAVNSRAEPDPVAIEFALDLLKSRVAIVEDSSPTLPLRSTRPFIQLRADMQELLEMSDATLKEGEQSRVTYALLAARLRAAIPAVNALTMHASAMVSHQQEDYLEQQENDVQTVIALLGALLVLLLASAVVIARRQEQVERERARMLDLHTQLLEANAKAEAANRGKSQFLANMSHELRTPFNGMLGMLSLLENTPVNAQQVDYIQTATRSARHLLALLNDILDASAIEAGKLNLKALPISLRVLFADIHALMKPLALEKRLGLEVQLSRHLPAWLMADDTRVKQIVLNLVSNAIKFSTQGTIRVYVRAEPDATVEEGCDATISVEVRDDGVGMSPDALSRLFRRFEQGDASSSRQFGGTGLGLEISRTLCRLMEGDISVVSTAGVGSTFTAVFRLPVVGAPAQSRADTVPVRRAAGSPGLNVLVAEDNAINRKYMAALLAHMGHDVRFAEHGGQAVEAVREMLPDIVLMDLHMPGIDGLQATQAIRSMDAPMSMLPIIALTADVLEESRDRVASVGMDGFLSKPIHIHALEQLLVQHFGERGASMENAAVAQDYKGRSAPENVAKPDHPAAAARPRRRFRSGDVVEHINMAMVGELCVGVTLKGYQSLLDGVLGPQASSYTDLLEALEAGRTADLLELGHAFKGVAASLGLSALAKIALTVEKQGQAFSPAECQAWSHTLQEAWENTLALCTRMGFVVSE